MHVKEVKPASLQEALVSAVEFESLVKSSLLSFLCFYSMKGHRQPHGRITRNVLVLRVLSSAQEGRLLQEGMGIRRRH